MANKKLHKAKTGKNDEFYTQFSDIQNEVNAYIEYNPDVFKDKTILLPCDDPEWSNFTKFFAQNFEKFKLKKLISTSYAYDSKHITEPYQLSLFESESPQFDRSKTKSNGKIFTLDRDLNKSGKIDINDLEWKYLDGDGDFRSEEVIKLRDEADIVVTNPPFSLFKDFMKWLNESEKKFLIIGHQNAITYKEVFPYIKENKMWLGKGFKGGAAYFINKYYTDYATADNHQEGMIRVSGVVWFTNLEHGRRHKPLQLMTMSENIKYSRHKEINGHEYVKFDNYDAIDVPYTDAIPSDYDGVMGVPITFLAKYNPSQFKIIGIAKTPIGSHLRTKVYGQQIQHSIKNGKEVLSNVSKLNDGPAIYSENIPNKYPYYEVDGKYYISTYARILIKFKEEKNENNIEN